MTRRTIAPPADALNEAIRLLREAERRAGLPSFHPIEPEQTGTLAADAWIAVPEERPLPLLHRTDTRVIVIPLFATQSSIVREVRVASSLSA